MSKPERDVLLIYMYYG